MTSFPSLQIIGDAKSTSMAGSLVAVDGAVYFNPATTAFLENREISFAHTFWFEDIKLDNLTFLYPTLEQGVFGIGLTYLYTVVEERNTDTEIPVGEFKFNDGFLVFSYSKRVVKNFSVGSNLKIIRETIENVQAKGFAIDLGLFFKPNLPISQSLNLPSFGLSVQNIGPKIKFIEAEEKLPLSINFGTSWEIKKKITLNIEIDSTESENIFKSGCEFRIKNVLALRAGYNTKNVSDLGGLAGFSFGNGLKLKNYQFDFAFSPYGILGNTYIISGNYKW